MFMLKSGDVVWDPDLDVLAEILLVLDRHLASIRGEWKRSLNVTHSATWTGRSILPGWVLSLAKRILQQHMAL